MSSLAAAPLASSAKKPFLVVAKESALPPFWGFAFEAVEEEVWERAKGEGWASWLDGQYVLGRGWGEWVWLFRVSLLFFLCWSGMVWRWRQRQ